MASRGYEETKYLIQNLQDQLDRLVSELDELEQTKEELERDEYEEAKKDKLEQFEDIRRSLDKFSSGSQSLIDEVGAMQLAIQAAISQAFKTPEIIKMFAKNEPELLRAKLHQIESDLKLNKILSYEGNRIKLEILTALTKLGAPLSEKEEEFMLKGITNELDKFQKINQSTICTIDNKKFIQMANNSN